MPSFRIFSPSLFSLLCFSFVSIQRTAAPPAMTSLSTFYVICFIPPLTLLAFSGSCSALVHCISPCWANVLVMFQSYSSHQACPLMSGHKVHIMFKSCNNCIIQLGHDFAFNLRWHCFEHVTCNSGKNTNIWHITGSSVKSHFAVNRKLFFGETLMFLTSSMMGSTSVCCPDKDDL